MQCRTAVPQRQFWSATTEELSVLVRNDWGTVSSDLQRLRNCHFWFATTEKLSVPVRNDWETVSFGPQRLRNCPFRFAMIEELSVSVHNDWETVMSGLQWLGNCPFWFAVTEDLSVLVRNDLGTVSFGPQRLRNCPFRYTMTEKLSVLVRNDWGLLVLFRNDCGAAHQSGVLNRLAKPINSGFPSCRSARWLFSPKQLRSWNKSAELICQQMRPLLIGFANHLVIAVAWKAERYLSDESLKNLSFFYQFLSLSLSPSFSTIGTVTVVFFIFYHWREKKNKHSSVCLPLSQQWVWKEEKNKHQPVATKVIGQANH